MHVGQSNKEEEIILKLGFSIFGIACVLVAICYLFWQRHKNKAEMYKYCGEYKVTTSQASQRLWGARHLVLQRPDETAICLHFCTDHPSHLLTKTLAVGEIVRLVPDADFGHNLPADYEYGVHDITPWGSVIRRLRLEVLDFS